MTVLLDRPTHGRGGRTTVPDGTHYLLPLDRADDLGSCGGKACQLARALRLGLPVPAGFVVADRAFQDFLDTNRLRPRIDDLCRGLDARAPEAVRTAARSVRTLVEEALLPAVLVAELGAAVAAWPPGTELAVRSSAVGEDSAHAAFAGQLDTVLGVRSAEAVLEALRRCWASYWSERSLSYRLTRGAELNGMAVVVQEQVAAYFSGVLFTRPPDPAAGDVMVAEYCFGLGEALVSGRINPGRLAIQWDGGAWRLEAVPELGDGDDGPGVTDAVVGQLRDAGLRLEAAAGAPQDVEWSVDRAGRFFVLQSRPITAFALARTANPPGPLQVFSNANVNENYPDPISPFLYSIAAPAYSHYFRNLGLALGISRRRVAAVARPLQSLVGAHGGRLYYNLTNIHAILRMAPFGEFLTQSFNLFTGTGATSPNGGPRRPFPAQVAEVCRIALTAAWRFARLPRGVEEFERTVDRFAQATAPALLERRSPAELLADLRGFLDIRFHRWVNASLADAASMLSYGLLKRVLGREFSGADCSALHNDLLKGLRDVASAEPVARLWALSRTVRNDPALRHLFETSTGGALVDRLRRDERFTAFRAEFDAYLEGWGFRRSGELLLTRPSFQDDPAALLDIVRAYVALDGGGPADALERQNADRLRETARVLRALRGRPVVLFLPWPNKALLVRRLLAWTQQAISLRERARHKQALLYSRCRHIALALGAGLVARGHLGEREDVFFLSVPELEALLEGSSLFPEQTRQVVALRREAHARLTALELPEQIELPAGTYYRPPEANVAAGPVAGDGTPTLTGVGVCGGRATATAAVLNDVSEFARLSRGDVLVARQTDPGWGPVFFLISGLVMERGGMLSHGAILAREYGIPTVVGVPDATRRIAHGQVVTVNGDRGVVELVS